MWRVVARGAKLGNSNLVFIANRSSRMTSSQTQAGAGSSGRKVYVLGVGMTKFEKPNSRTDFDYPDMVRESVTAALQDSKVQYTEVQQAVCGYVYGDSTCGQRALYQLGMTGLPVVNVNNNCSTGGTAIFLARQAILAGFDCVLAVGFEKMQKGSLQSQFSDRLVHSAHACPQNIFTWAYTIVYINTCVRACLYIIYIYIYIRDS